MSQALDELPWNWDAYAKFLEDWRTIVRLEIWDALEREVRNIENETR